MKLHCISNYNTQPQLSGGVWRSNANANGPIEKKHINFRLWVKEYITYFQNCLLLSVCSVPPNSKFYKSKFSWHKIGQNITLNLLVATQE